LLARASGDDRRGQDRDRLDGAAHGQVDRLLPRAPGGAALETAASVFTTANLWALCILFAGWVIGTVVSGPIGIAANALLVAWGLYSSYEILTELFKNGKEWAVLCYEAKSDADLKVAGAVFAKLFVGGLADMLQVVILHRTFRSLRAKINSKIPPPAEVEGFKKGSEAKDRAEDRAEDREQACD
jgi:hypothetical protein